MGAAAQGRCCFPFLPAARRPAGRLRERNRRDGCAASDPRRPPGRRPNERKDRRVTTATRKRTDPLAELEARERAHAEAKAHASELGSEFGAVSRQLAALQDQRRRLVFHQPGLVDHHGQPNPDVDDNPVAAVDTQIAELGHVEDLHARMLHARQLEQSAKQAADDYTAAHLDELLAVLEPAAVDASAEVARAMAQLGEAGAAYLNLARRVDGWRGTDRTRQHLRVPAIDVASDLVRMADGYGVPPLATELR